MATPARRPLSLAAVLLCLTGTLAIGLLVKAPCANGNWADGRQYVHYCYSDIEPLLGTEQLTGGRLPFLDACGPGPGECDEYPVLTMYAMRLAAWMSHGAGNLTSGFFYANVILLTFAAVVVTVGLYVLAGERALYFALAPTLLVYGFINWDLLAVAFATLATVAFLRRRDVWSGLFLGLGMAAKLYPLLLVVPFVAQRFREHKPDDGVHLAWSAAGTWVLVNAPFALAAPKAWWEFFRFNLARPADWDSLWFVAYHRLAGPLCCAPSRVVSVGSVALFVAAVWFVWRAKSRIDPAFARWTLGLPILMLFLLSNKVYSPQYGLWLLPWFALALPSPQLFVAFSAADVVVFLTRFSWFGRYSGFGGLPIGVFEIAILVRAAVLVWCLVVWVRRGTAAPVPSRPPIVVPAELPA